MKNKDLIYWEEIEESKKQSKWKRKISYILGKLSVISGLIEGILLLIITLCIGNNINQIVYFGLLILSGYLIFRSIKHYYYVWKGKQILIYEENNKRVIGQEGAQGSGKTSLMFYIASIMNQPIFTSAPARINGKMTYKLTTDMMDMKVRLPFKSIIIIDEITLYFDNSLGKFQDNIKTKGLEMQMQLIRHCYDGQMLSASVDMNRVAKRIEEKHGMFRRLLGQKSVNNSFIIDPLLKLIGKCFDLNIKTGYRVWTYQTFENIDHKGYIFDLSRANSEKSPNANHFANLNEIWAFNSGINFEYDDRYFRNLYLKIPKAELEEWNDLTFKYEELESTGFNSIVKFFKELYKEGGKNA